MTRRTLYLARHGEADALGSLTDRGREQSRQLGRRLAAFPIDVLWHSPLGRAAHSAAVIAERLPPILVDEATELVDHIPFVPDLGDVSSTWAAFFDGTGVQEAAAGRRTAQALTSRFAKAGPDGGRPSHEVLVTHAYPVAWMVRDAFGAPAQSWMSLAGIDNTGLTIIEYDRGAPPTVRCVNDLSHLVGLAPGTASADGAGR